MKSVKIFLILIVGFFYTNSVNAQAVLKVGNNRFTINPNSVLEIEATNKGLLLPRIDLQSTTLAAPLSAHIQGMSVYNKATAGDVTPGFYYNDGTKWVKLAKENLDNNLVLVNDSLTSTTTPSGAGMGHIIYNTNSAIFPVGPVVWNGSQWVPLINTYTASNGLNAVGNTIELGGTLDKPTTITVDATNKLSIAGTGVDVFNVDGTTLSVDATNNSLGLGTAVPNSTLQIAGSMATAIRNVATNTTLTNTDNIVICDTSAGNVTITLPNATTCAGRVYTVKKVDKSYNIISFDPVINTSPADSFTTLNYQRMIKIQSDGANWWLMD